MPYLDKATAFADVTTNCYSNICQCYSLLFAKFLDDTRHLATLTQTPRATQATGLLLEGDKALYCSSPQPLQLKWAIVGSVFPYRMSQIGRAHVCTPVTNAHLVCRLMLAKQNKYAHEQ